MPLTLSATLPAGHTDRAWHVSWHPTLPLLASCGGDRAVRVWAPARAGGARGAGGAWAAVAVLDDFTTRTARCAEWSPCGRLLAAASFDGAATVWDVRGRALRRGEGAGAAARLVRAGDVRFARAATLRGHDNEVKGVAWSAAGDALATCGRDMSVWVWMVVEGEGAGAGARARGESDEGGGDGDDAGGGDAADAASDASGGAAATDFECVAVLHGHDADVKSVAFHPTDDLLVSASYDEALHSWAPDATGDWSAAQKLPGAHAATVWAWAWAPDGARGASGGDDGALKTWTARASAGGGAPRTLAPLRAAARAHAGALYSVAFSPCGRFLATAGADDALRVWDAETLAPLAEARGAHAGDANCVRWAPGGGLLATAGDDGEVRVWEWKEGAAEGAAAPT